MSWIAFSVDVEEWFHILDTDRSPPRSEWNRQPNHVEANTRRLLDLLDRAEVPGTFFTLGWVAERYPDLVREIAPRTRPPTATSTSSSTGRRSAFRETRCAEADARGRDRQRWDFAAGFSPGTPCLRELVCRTPPLRFSGETTRGLRPLPPHRICRRVRAADRIPVAPPRSDPCHPSAGGFTCAYPARDPVRERLLKRIAANLIHPARYPSHHLPFDHRRFRPT
jgi:hypothetical protein